MSNSPISITFGFLILRRLFPKPEIEEIIRDFEEVLAEARGGLPFDGVQRQGITGSFIEKRLSLMRLLEEDRIHRPIEQLLGKDYLYRGSEGNLMVGDTADWHPDGYRPWLHPDGWQLTLAKVQLVFYLDVLTKDTGSLRVVPGSHRPPLYEELKRILAYRPEAHYGLARSNFAGEVDPDSQPFAVEPRDLPCFPLETDPGDVLLWSPNLWHSAFGGRTGRRMFRNKLRRQANHRGAAWLLAGLSPATRSIHSGRKIRSATECMTSRSLLATGLISVSCHKVCRN